MSIEIPRIRVVDVSEEDKYNSRQYTKRQLKLSLNIIKHNVMCHLVLVLSFHPFDSFSLNQYYFGIGVINNNTAM